MRRRVTALIIRESRIVLIHRIKFGQEYWVFPGGGVEGNETDEEAVFREVEEETGLVCKSIKLLGKIAIDRKDGVVHPVFACDVIGEELKLGGPELVEHSEENWFNPEWVEIGTLKGLNIWPGEALEYIK